MYVRQIRQLMKEGKIVYTAFTRAIEKVSIIDNIAVTMRYVAFRYGISYYIKFEFN